jgi:Zn-dependent peptidase ImmA (M78 family)
LGAVYLFNLICYYLLMGISVEKKPIPVNPEILRWAREQSKLTIDRVAELLKVPKEKVVKWESKESELAPAVGQARKLAKKYKRHFLEFFFDEIPHVHRLETLPDYRLYSRTKYPLEDDIQFQELQRIAISQRINTIDLYEEIGEQSTEIPKQLFSTIDDSTEEKSIIARKLLELNQSDNSEHRIPSDFQQYIRNRIESIGILTLKLSELKKMHIRGFCIAEFPLPVIAFSSEHPHAQIFTMMHELGHIILKKSGIVGKLNNGNDFPDIRRVENWCNKFSAATLMPKNEIIKIIPVPQSPFKSIEDDKLKNIAKRFSVSEHAMLIRLVYLGYIDERYYWDKKRAQFEKQEEDYKSYSKSPYHAKRYVNKYGHLYTGLVMQAWADGRITNHCAAQYMGIGSMNNWNKHIKAIRDNEFGI